MRQVIEIDPKLWQQIQALLHDGRFESISQFTTVAIENQLLLESNPSDQSTNRVFGVSGPSVEASEEQSTGRISSGLTALSISTEQPSVEKLAGRGSNEIAWGLYNRIFPVKITLRVLSQLLTKGGSQSIDLKVLGDEASLQAKNIGRQLVSARKKSSTAEKLFTGLPFRRADKAAERFKKMFVGTITKSGKAEGFPVFLRFIVLRREGTRATVSLTDAGYAFARLRNPVLDIDGADSVPYSALSVEESDFYMSHLEKAVPREWELCRLLIENISEGINTTERVDQLLKQTVRDLKPALVPPTRSGLISRLSELGLVQRRQDGLRVIYTLTAYGERYLKSIQTRRDKH
jgi:DnaJ-domain-containing protein 1